MSKAMAAALRAVSNMDGRDNSSDLAWDVYRHPEAYTLIKGFGPFPDVYISERPSVGKQRHVCVEASEVAAIQHKYGRVQ